MAVNCGSKVKTKDRNYASRYTASEARNPQNVFYRTKGDFIDRGNKIEKGEKDKPCKQRAQGLLLSFGRFFVFKPRVDHSCP